MKIMLKKVLAATALAALPLAGFANEPPSAVSDIVGFTKEALPAGNVILSPNFLNSTVFQGKIISANLVDETAEEASTDVSLDGQPFDGVLLGLGTSGFPTHYLQVVSSTDANLVGVVADILSNSSGVMTVDGDFSALSVDDVVLVRPHVTLDQVFAKTPSLLAFSDTVTFFEVGGGRTSSIWFGTAWSQNLGSRPIYPGDSILFTSSSPTEIETLGTVRADPVVVPLFAGSLNFVSLVHPVRDSTTTLGSLDLGDTLLAFADSVTIYSRSGNLQPLQSFVWFGSALGWSNNGNDFVITDDHSILVSTSTNKTWTAPALLAPNN